MSWTAPAEPAATRTRPLAVWLTSSATVKLFDAEADSILWAAEGLLLANSPTEPEAVEARTTFDTLMHVLAAHAGRTAAQRPPRFSVSDSSGHSAECAPLETVSASA